MLSGVIPVVKKVRGSAVLIRAIPFLIFITLTSCQGLFGEASRYWIYAGKSLLGAGMIWGMWPFVAEMRWVLSWEAVVTGVAVLVMWIGIDDFYPKFGRPAAGWNPPAQFGQGSTLTWIIIVARILGASLVVPPLEEVFYRSFLYRYLIKSDLQSVPPGFFNWKAFLATSVVFGFSHYEWLAGILCGFAYQGLVCWKKRLGDAITAHAITNFLLGLWVVWKGAWHFW